MPDPFDSTLQYVCLVLAVTLSCMGLDFLHRKNVHRLRLRPLPSLWMMELSFALTVALIACAVALYACQMTGYFYASSILLHQVFPVLALTFTASISLVVLREFDRALITARHTPDVTRSRKHRYVYILRREWQGEFSFHVRKAEFYDFATSDISFAQYTPAILDMVYERLKPGDNLVLATPNDRIRSSLTKRIKKYFATKGASIEEGWTQPVPPAQGIWMNLRHGWGYPLLSRITMRGARISLPYPDATVDGTDSPLAQQGRATTAVGSVTGRLP
ncbi:MAG: hypothetical protein ACREPD_04305 [Stenotrophomonas sp.]|uniref:hypothetical protein n=1 Tax=Stenotrophomonas sp. TaxID=69392 RepID=UPI003D6CC0F4